MKASSRSFRRRNMSTRLLTTAVRFSLVASEVSTRMPSDMGPVVESTRRLRTGDGGGFVVSAQTDGAGCEVGALETAGGLEIGAGCGTAGGRAAAVFTGGGLAFRGCGTGGRAVVEASIVEFAVVLEGAAAARNWFQSVVLPPSFT